jgi:hypothetical protein
MEGAPSAGLPRPQSVEDLVGGLWKLGRTPSEAEFTQFLSASGAHQAGGAGQGDTPTMAGAAAAATLGMHRVASIDLLRKMILNQQAVMSQAQAAASASVAEHAGLAGVPLAGGASACRAAVPRAAPPRAAAPPRCLAQPDAAARRHAAPLLAPTALPVVFPPVLPDWGKVLAGRAAEAAAAAGASAPPSAGKAKAPAPAKVKESARAKAAKERAAAAAAELAAAEDDDEDDDPDGEEYDEADVLKSMGKGPFTAEEIRRQRRCGADALTPDQLADPRGGSVAARRARAVRAAASHALPAHARGARRRGASHAAHRLTRRCPGCVFASARARARAPFFASPRLARSCSMLSNRESARRSRRRKLEHVHTLQGQARCRGRAARTVPRPLLSRLRPTLKRARRTRESAFSRQAHPRPHRARPPLARAHARR